MRKMQKWCLRRKALARVLQAATFSLLLVLMALPGMIAEAGSAGEAALLLLVMGGGAVAAGTRPCWPWRSTTMPSAACASIGTLPWYTERQGTDALCGWAMCVCVQDSIRPLQALRRAKPGVPVLQAHGAAQQQGNFRRPEGINQRGGNMTAQAGDSCPCRDGRVEHA